MRETNTASSASVAGLELMRLGPELTFLAWNDRGGKMLCRKLCGIAIPPLRTQDIANASMSQLGFAGLDGVWLSVTLQVSYQPSQ